MHGVWQPKVLFYAWGLAAAVVVTPSEVVLAIGAVVYAVLLFKGQRGKVLRDQNRDLGERNVFLESELVRVKAEMADQAADEQAIRHELKNQVALLNGQLELEQAKHDMNAVTDKLEAALEILHRRESMFREMAAGIAELARIAREDRPQPSKEDTL